MSDTVPVVSQVTHTTTDVAVTAAYSGGGAAVDYSTASVAARLINMSEADDIWYRIDSGAWTQLTEHREATLTIDFATQTLTLKRGEFTSASISVRVVAEGVPSGTYAQGQTLGGAGMSEEDLPAALADLGVVQTAVVDLDSEQIATGNSSPIEVIPAPGPGKVILYGGAVAASDGGAIPYPNSSSTDGNFFYDGSDVILNDPVLLIANGLDDVLTGPATPVSFTTDLLLADAVDKALVFTLGNDNPNGAVATINPVPDVGGSGYAPGDQFLIGPLNAIGEVDTVDGGGAVLTWHLVSGGFDQSPGAGQATAKLGGGGDDALTVTVLTITPATGTARLWIKYQILTLPT